MVAGTGIDLIWVMKDSKSRGKSQRKPLKPGRGLSRDRRVSEAWSLGVVRERPLLWAGSSVLASGPKALNLENTSLCPS